MTTPFSLYVPLGRCPLAGRSCADADSPPAVPTYAGFS
jgi:hypothetical protein